MRAAHVILGYKPISSSFQSPKNVIKAKDPRLHQINVAMPGFLTGPPPEGTHQVELPNQRATEEEVISSDSTQEEEATSVFEVVDLEEEDFEIFDQPHPTESPSNTSRPLPSAQINSNQKPADIPEAMVLQHKKNTSLLELLESHAGGLHLK